MALLQLGGIADTGGWTVHAFTIDLLGPIEVHRNGAVVHAGPIRQQELLAVLALRRGCPTSTSSLAADLWGPEPPPSVDNLVHTYVARLRRLLEPRVRGTRATLLRSTSAGYMLDMSADELDASRFEHLLGEAARARRRGDFDVVRHQLTAALHLWRGEPLQGAGGPRAQAERWRLDELRVQACEDLVEARLALCDHANLVAELRQMLTEHPFRERSWALLLTTLDRTSRRGEALMAYNEARQTLIELLGIEPGVELEQAYRRLLVSSTA